MEHLLEVEHLYKSFPIQKGFFRRIEGYVHAVLDATFTIKPGEVVGVVGESGSGKTTLGRTILRLLEPTSGKILFCGQDITKLSYKKLKELRKEMQIVFQNPAQSLNPRHTVSDTIGEVLAFHQLCRTGEEKRMKTAAVLEKVGLDKSVMNFYPHELSIGQQQRVAIARALSVEPKLLVLDECVSALDVSIQAQVLNLLLELLQSMNMSYLFISHDLSVVSHISDRVLVMAEGVIVEQGWVEDVLERPQHPYTQLLLSSNLSAIPKR